MTTPLSEYSFKLYQKRNADIEKTLAEVQKNCEQLWQQLQTVTSPNNSTKCTGNV
jgi:prefoldin subunit 5